MLLPSPFKSGQESGPAEPANALRLGFRLVKGLREEDAKAIWKTAARLTARSTISPPAVAFRSAS